jgi:hypothetical protein
MSINTAGLPPYTEQITKKPISKSIAVIEEIKLIDRVKQEKRLNSIMYGKNKK